MSNIPSSTHKPDLEPIQFVNIGGIYLHYKGTKYKVIDIAVHTETKEKLVLYQQCSDGTLWARPMSSFCGLVTSENCLRFTPVEDING
jgi:hypothetical protein